MKTILVTGGLGYIGSHTVVSLINAGYQVVIIDNLSNSRISVLEGIEKITGIQPHFAQLDLCQRNDLLQFFEHYNDFAGVIHFAAFKSVSESVKKPLKYYHNNLVSLVNLLEMMQTFSIPNLIFSSSCTVYGQPDTLPVTEETPLQPAECPYGETKQMSEKIILDTTKATEIQAISLRYFNPIGAHPTALIGELPLGIPDNLLPYLTQTAIGKREYLSVFGSDYNTPDGTPIRDYIHVCDLAEAHVKALEYIDNQHNTSQYEIFNLGTGKGYSVLEVIQSFEKVSGLKLNYRLTDRRPGDVEQIWADASKAAQILNWKTSRNLDNMVESAWKWELYLKNNPSIISNQYE